MNNDILRVVDELFPGLTSIEKMLIQDDLLHLLESKDIGRFTGEISPFKQKAIDVSVGPKTKLKLEKDASKKLEILIDKLITDMEYFLGRLKGESDRVITKSKFKEEMKKVLRVAYLDAYKLGTRAAGLVRATDFSFHLGADEKKWLDKVFFSEQKYFEKFLDDVIAGESKTKSKVRIKNYANALRSVFDSSRMLQLPDDSIIHWVLQSNNPCSDCRLLHRLSPYTRDTLPTTPKSGSTRCFSNCYCKLRVVEATPSEVNKVRRKNKNAQHVLKKLQRSRKAA